MVINLTRLLVGAGRDYDVSVQSPIRLGTISEPEPDLALLRPGASGLHPEHPPPGSKAVLLIEVSDTTLHYDREVKRPLYARHGIPELWIVDVNARTIDVHRAPRNGIYEVSFTKRSGEPVVPLALPDLPIDVGDLGL